MTDLLTCSNSYRDTASTCHQLSSTRLWSRSFALSTDNNMTTTVSSTCSVTSYLTIATHSRLTWQLW